MVDRGAWWASHRQDAPPPFRSLDTYERAKRYTVGEDCLCLGSRLEGVLASVRVPHPKESGRSLPGLLQGPLRAATLRRSVRRCRCSPVCNHWHLTTLKEHIKRFCQELLVGRVFNCCDRA